MEKSELRERVYQMIGEDPSNPERFTDAEIDRFVNDSYIQIVNDTHCLEVKERQQGVVGQAVYSVTERVATILRIAWDDYSISAENTRVMDRGDSQWRTRTGAVELWTSDKQDAGSFRLYKKPTAVGDLFEFASEYGRISDMGSTYLMQNERGVTRAIDILKTDDSKTYVFNQDLGVIRSIEEHILEVWGKKHPEELLRESDSPEIPTYAHLAVAYLAASKALDRGTEGGNVALSALYRQMAEDESEILRINTENRIPERRNVRGKGSRVRRPITRDNSIPATGRAGAGD